MPHDIKAKEKYAVIEMKIAIAETCPDTIADGLNELLRPLIGEGFIADYSFTNTENPTIVIASGEPEEGELFEPKPCLSEKVKALMIQAIEITGECNDGCIYMFEERLTFEEANMVHPFLEWVGKNNLKFGTGNVDQVFADWVEAASIEKDKN